jgi:hypothetical protein
MNGEDNGAAPLAAIERPQRIMAVRDPLAREVRGYHLERPGRTVSGFAT